MKKILLLIALLFSCMAVNAEQVVPSTGEQTEVCTEGVGDLENGFYKDVRRLYTFTSYSYYATYRQKVFDTPFPVYNSISLKGEKFNFFSGEKIFYKYDSYNKTNAYYYKFLYRAYYKEEKKIADRIVKENGMDYPLKVNNSQETMAGWYFASAVQAGVSVNAPGLTASAQLVAEFNAQQLNSLGEEYSIAYNINLSDDAKTGTYSLYSSHNTYKYIEITIYPNEEGHDNFNLFKFSTWFGRARTYSYSFEQNMNSYMKFNLTNCDGNNRIFATTIIKDETYYLKRISI